jgi:hypothetical protein
MTKITRRTFGSAAALLSSLRFTAARAQTGIAPAEARATAKKAYIYGFPLVDNYRAEYAYFVDRQNSEFKAPWNQIANIPRVFTPADVAVQTLMTPLINTLRHYTKPRVRENNGCWSSRRVNASINGRNQRSGIVGIRS